MNSEYIGLWRCKEDNMYYYNGENKTCSKCECLIEKMIVIETGFDKKKRVDNFFCVPCAKSVNRFGSYNEIKMGVITSIIPEKSFPLFPTAPSLSNIKNISIWAAGNPDNDKKIHSDTMALYNIMDNTKLANTYFPTKEEIKEIEKQPLNNLEITEDKPLENIDAFLLGVKKNRLIKYGGKKMITN